MPDISIVPWWFSPWGAEKDPECARIADRILHRLLPAATELNRANAVEIGLDPTEMAIVEVLGVIPVLRLTALADRLALSPAAASRAAARLERRTWVDRGREIPGGVEVRRARGTDEVVEASLQDVRSPLAAAVAALGPDERAVVSRFLLTVTDILATRAGARGDRRYRRGLDRRRREWDRRSSAVD